MYRGKLSMRKSIFLSALLIWLAASAACGKTEEEETVYYDFQVESRTLTEAGTNQTILGRQYYRGEPVSIIGELVTSEEKGSVLDVYLQPAGEERQLMMSGISRGYRSIGWYMDGEGNCFVPLTDGIVRLDGDGNMLYHSKTGCYVKDICELEDGRMILLTNDGNGFRLAELDPATGVLEEIDNVALENKPQYIGASGDGLMLLDETGFWHVDLKKGTKTLEMPFAGTLYAMQRGRTADFWVDGSRAGIIWEDGLEEQLTRVNAGEGKEVIVVRGFNYDYNSMVSYIKDMLYRFNRSSDTYYATLEELEKGTSQADFRTETNLKLAAGKGADIIVANALPGDVYSLIDKGVFADLKPLMEASGMSEEDYFPAAFGWRQEEGIYGVGLDLTGICHTMDKSLLEEGRELTIDTFLDIMLDPNEKRILFSKSVSSPADGSRILDYLLCGSEDLWGVIDWESGTCDFSGERFARILQAAEKCAYDKRYDYPGLLDARRCNGLYRFDTDEILEKKNLIVAGYLFDDGCHGANIGSYYMGINAASPNIEGAWQLLKFLMGEEAQMEMGKRFTFPVNKEAFARIAQEELELGAVEMKTIVLEDGTTIEVPSKVKGDGIDLTQETIDEISRYLENLRALPIKTETILTLIEEEAADYFSGLKSREQVTASMQNRVQLYLDEQKGL